ncbi:hypothetical protein IA931_15105, partial [Listeria welshimeri]|nr:hypothetical protein [Listeria welshimeri]
MIELAEIGVAMENGIPLDLEKAYKIAKHQDSQDDVVILYNWSIKENQEVHAGDTVHLQVPKEFKIYTTVSGDLIVGDNGESCGEFEIDTDGMMTITFDDYVENHSIIHGIVEIYTNFNEAELGNN